MIGTALVGFRDPAEVTENLGALGWVISTADMAEIDAILARHNCVTVPPGWLEDSKQSAGMPKLTIEYSSRGKHL